MSLDVETVVAIAVMMAVFSAVAAVGTSIVLGAGFERLRSGFEVIRKQTGFFSDAINKLEKKVEQVDAETGKVTQAIATMESKVMNVGEQANIFSDSISKLERKVEVVDKQTGFFGDAIHKLERKIDSVDSHEKVLKDKMSQHADTDLISTEKTEALVSHAEDLLSQMSVLADKMVGSGSDAGQYDEQITAASQSSKRLSIPQNLSYYAFDEQQDNQEIRYH